MFDLAIWCHMLLKSLEFLYARRTSKGIKCSMPVSFSSKFLNLLYNLEGKTTCSCNIEDIVWNNLCNLRTWLSLGSGIWNAYTISFCFVFNIILFLIKKNLIFLIVEIFKLHVDQLQFYHSWTMVCLNDLLGKKNRLFFDV